MKVNGQDIRKYNAKQLTVDLQPPRIGVDYEWLDGAPTPQEFETYIKAGVLKLSLLFRGDSRSQIMRSISEFMALLTQSVVIQLDGYKGYFAGSLSDNQIGKTISKTRYTLSLTLDGYLMDDEIKNTYTGKSEARFDALGTRDAPCIVEVTPTEDLETFTITGFGTDPIAIHNLTAGERIIIDGAAGTATQNGVNKFGDIDLWAFPMLTRGGKYTIGFSSTACVVVIRYHPMWL